MKKTIIAVVFTLSILTYFSQSEVYVCKRPSSKKYHLTEKCRGLSNCSTKIYKVKLSEAKKMNRTLCGWED